VFTFAFKTLVLLFLSDNALYLGLRIINYENYGDFESMSALGFTINFEEIHFINERKFTSLNTILYKRGLFTFLL
jgi:hypothetical protein